MSTPAGAPAPTAADVAHRRRSLTIASVLLAVAAAALWGSSRLSWASLVAADGIGVPRDFTVRGSDWSSYLTPLAIVLLAAIAAAVSLRGWGLRILAVIVALIGVASVAPAISLLTGDSGGTYAAKSIDLPGRYQVTSIETHPLAAVLVFVSGLFAVAAAVVIMRAARGAVGLSSKYKSPAARRADLEEQIFADRCSTTGSTDTKSDPGPERGADAPESTEGDGGGLNERMLWDALDNGADPTASTSDETDPRHRPDAAGGADDGPR
ncbi:TIGR02234 family membrane protein [Williamsia phyllosphaerae]|uniref:Membrane protein n=1 Tax=Williamsia phyllosphaerae TaxID=885042 RepID=A0ABQ1UZ83_9NOCA|nr:TIGR02234 family membrane protein [Williamsia phyllosphaerae]GGF30033.1 membrane protein [Williamsia phyllosphaerae]